MTLHLLFCCWNNMHEIDRRFLSGNFPSAKFRSCTSLHFVYKFNNIFLFKCDLRCLCNVQCPIQVKNWTTNSQDVDKRSKCFCCTQTQHVGLPHASVGDVKPNMLGHCTQSRVCYCQNLPRTWQTAGINVDLFCNIFL